MRIKLINPNTSEAMTKAIGVCAETVAAPGTVIDAVNPAMGPESIESHYDEALSVPGVLAEIAKGEAEGADAYVIACFGDPGIDAARELASGPVIGVAEAAMHTAALLGRGFSVVTTLARTGGRAWDLAHRYGAAQACRAVRACEVPVLELQTDPQARATILAECREALAVDGADVLVLGCAGMADLAGDLSAVLGVPVVDGVAAGTLLAQSLVTMGLQTSTHLEFAPPGPKAYAGLLAGFSTIRESPG